MTQLHQTVATVRTLGFSVRLSVSSRVMTTAHTCSEKFVLEISSQHILTLQDSVMMEILDLLELPHQLSMRVVLSSAMVKNGVLSAMTPGMILMPLLFADSLATLIQVWSVTVS